MDSSGPIDLGGSEEREVVIAFVDLTQFTALTDIHGDFAAAEASTMLSEMALELEVADTRVVKSVGDGVLLEAATRAGGMAAVVGLIEGVHEHGLEARAGVDYGPIVRRGADVFGRTVNLASRLSAVARPGKVAMARVMALQASRLGLPVTPLGLVDVRGFRESLELFSVDPCSHQGRWFTDPVCGMRVDEAGAATLATDDGQVFGFCSTRCADIFAVARKSNELS